MTMDDQVPSIENLKESIKMRGLQEMTGGPRTPLREFIGRLVSWDARMDTNPNFERSRIMVQLNFDELQVIRAEQPYDFPTATLEIPYSGTARSQWGYFSKSAEPFTPGDVTEFSQGAESLIGHQLHIGYEDNVNGLPCMIWNGQPTVRKEEQRSVFVIKAVDGMTAGATQVNGAGQRTAAADTLDRLATLVNGLSKAAASQALMKEQFVRDSSDLVNKVISGDVYTELVTAGKIKDEGGKFVKVEG
jgi:hypothetical protein